MKKIPTVPTYKPAKPQYFSKWPAQTVKIGILLVLFLVIVGITIAIVVVAVQPQSMTTNQTPPQQPPQESPGLQNKLICSGGIKETFDTLGRKESGKEGNDAYAVVNSLGFTGKYQVGEALLIDLKYYNSSTYYPVHTTSNLWKGVFTGKNGLTSYSTLLSNFTIQEIIIREAFVYNHGILQTYLTNVESYLGLRTFKASVCANGGNITTVTVTLPGLLTAAHLVGAIGIGGVLKNNNTPACDEIGTSPIKYIKDFEGCQFTIEELRAEVQKWTG
ncbi:hypothetical protein BKA69DRAFT_1066681 [Paraphysoderma sedebokerense]|nr:hypothetical protein BKA69DRAFT_1066624 [Paraphysoderma sedebokerense]KAI9142501.1 hypothetical protein BKA69DRAFT_1066681 [Paraphysoderma sedebokerense]